jgi:hypothetical protein
LFLEGIRMWFHDKKEVAEYKQKLEKYEESDDLPISMVYMAKDFVTIIDAFQKLEAENKKLKEHLDQTIGEK